MVCVAAQNALLADTILSVFGALAYVRFCVEPRRFMALLMVLLPKAADKCCLTACTGP